MDEKILQKVKNNELRVIAISAIRHEAAGVAVTIDISLFICCPAAAFGNDQVSLFEASEPAYCWKGQKIFAHTFVWQMPFYNIALMMHMRCPTPLFSCYGIKQ